ncbi:pre-mRNA-splicing factor CWC22 homolog [Chelonus insularis]|uniref:pre-mRNA-splicing factor CWC22 homolog n=1 Tax=Chelonus insularis TaxID=460826 RepID=UPI00158CA7B5|nr:pre-mRNA-splicing factor CWC22 homolog [Chelonus insularis]
MDRESNSKLRRSPFHERSRREIDRYHQDKKNKRNRYESRHRSLSDSEHNDYERRRKDDRENRKRRRSRSPRKNKEQKNSPKIQEEEDKELANITPAQKKTVDLLTSKTGGAYIPPAKLRIMQAEITDKSSAAYQRIAWEALKKSIHGYINKVNTTRSIIQAQAASPTFTPVYAALTAVINSKFPNIGELLLKRLVIQFKRGFRRNDKPLSLELLTLLIETPTDDSVEVAIAFLKECGMKLTQVSKKGIESIFEILRNILHEGQLDKRVQYMIEVVFQIRKDGFKDHVAVSEELDLVEEEDQFTHTIELAQSIDGEDI